MLTSRRDILAALAAVPLAAHPATAQNRLDLTPQCDDGDEPTIRQTEGPYFSPNSPLKSDFAADRPNGQRITLAGHVLDTDCAPRGGALIELWHADETGAYDNRGFTLRGHQFTDATGFYAFETIVPGLYPGRTRHYHLKVQRPGGGLLTTQLYFPDEPGNATDRIFDPRLTLTLGRAHGLIVGRYDFIVT